MNNSDNRNEFDGGEEIILDFPPIADIEKEKRVFSRLGFGMALFVLTVLLSSFVVVIVAGLIGGDFVNSVLFDNLLSPICIYGFGLPVLMAVIGKMDISVPEKKQMKLSSWLLILLVGFGLMYIGAYIGNSVMSGLSQAFHYDYSNGLNDLIDYNSLWITAIFMVVVAPIGEEFIFRKLIIDRTGKYGSVVSILLSALMFGLMHSNFYQFFYAFALGIVLGYVYYNTGKLHLTILLHAVLNFSGSILATLLQGGLDSLMSDIENASEDALLIDVLSEHWATILFTVIFELFVLGAMACAIIIPIVMRRRIAISKGEVQLPRHQTFSTVMMNAGMIVMMAVFAVNFALNLLPI